MRVPALMICVSVLGLGLANPAAGQPGSKTKKSQSPGQKIILPVLPPKGTVSRPANPKLLPPKDPQKQQPESDRTIVVQLLKGGGDQAAIKINQDDVTWDNLEGRLNDIFKTRAEKVMFVKADPDLTFNEVAQVIDIAHAAGVDKVGLITAKIEAGQ